MLIFNQIPTAFPWYDKLEKQARYKENCESVCDFKLISPNNALLPFEFKRGDLVTLPTAWYLVNAFSGQVVNLTSKMAKVKSIVYNGDRYFYYDGSSLGITIPFGFYFSRLEFAYEDVHFSEVFHVPGDAFNVGENGPYLKFEWYSSCKISPFFYEDRIAGVPAFRNVMYLDSFITASEPEIQEETEEDGQGNKIPVYQKAVIPYRVTHIVPDYLKLAIVIMQMHDKISLTTARGLESGQIVSLTTNTVVEDRGCMSTVDILWEQDLSIIRTACC